MQAEWEEMARRNWISENQEAQNQVTISASEKVINSLLIHADRFSQPLDNFLINELTTTL